MRQHSQEFPWPNYYGNFNFFEARIRQHGRVSKLNSFANGRYDITRDNGELLRVFICDCYSFGVAEYIETKGHLGNLDAIIINSMWCGYTTEAKRHCRREKVGLFQIGQFMAALNKTEVCMYLDADEEESFRKNGWL